MDTFKLGETYIIGSEYGKFEAVVIDRMKDSVTFSASNCTYNIESIHTLRYLIDTTSTETLESFTLCVDKWLSSSFKTEVANTWIGDFPNRVFVIAYAKHQVRG